MTIILEFLNSSNPFMPLFHTLVLSSHPSIQKKIYEYKSEYFQSIVSDNKCDAALQLSDIFTWVEVRKLTNGKDWEKYQNFIAPYKTTKTRKITIMVIKNLIDSVKK